MSKAVKEIIVRDYRDRLNGVEEMLLVSIRGVSANDANSIRSGLAKKNIRVTVLRNTLARKAFEGTPLSALEPMLSGPTAGVYGGETVVEVAREIVELVKTFPGIELKGAVLDGELYAGEEGVKRLSTMPTREEAISQAVTLILSPARKLAAQVKGPGSRLAGIVKAIEEKLEKGETIARSA